MQPELFDVGTIPPLGTVPRRMHASVIRPVRYGEPSSAFQPEIVDVPLPRRGQVLVMVMAAGVNYKPIGPAGTAKPGSNRPRSRAAFAFEHQKQLSGLDEQRSVAKVYAARATWRPACVPR
jgi:hypothetical protein